MNRSNREKMMHEHIEKSSLEYDPNKEWEISEKTKKNDLAFWFPILEKSGVPTPHTTIIEAKSPFQDMIKIVDGQTSSVFEDLYKRLYEICYQHGLPCFLRTGHTSHKHYWKDTCYVDDLEKLKKHIYNLVEVSCLYDLPFKHWVVREFIPLKIGFNTFTGNMPINKERRYFFYKNKVLCHHAYWPKEAFEGYLTPDSEGWHILEQLNSEPPEEIEYLTSETMKVAKAFEHTGESWSVDWALSEDGKWYCIDMALMRSSYHDVSCPVAKSIRLIKSGMEMNFDKQ